MAHTCPRCGQYCDCRGDWDDCDFGIDWNCECECEGWGNDDGEDFEYDDDYDPNDSRNI